MNIPKELSDYEKNKKLCNSLKFGDVIINHWASDDNPHKVGVFVKKCSYSGHPSIEVTDIEGNFWYFHIDGQMKIEFAGSNIFSKAAFAEKDKENERLRGIIEKQFFDSLRAWNSDRHSAWEQFKIENQL